ncbi:MAG TPA: rhomboid family intramembrane serine protease [Rudaea sp.]|nr:rhomboid family intramembrane serine protease [Rudaea sp.]
MSTTLIIIGITALVSLLAMGNREWIGRLILWPPAIARHREYYRLLSYGLIHADGQHLLFNMITLYFFGRAVEPFYANHLGAFGFALFYAGGLVVSILPTYLNNRENPAYRSLGASGAVSAALFAFILLQPWATIYVFFFPLPAVLYAVLYVVYSIYMDRSRSDNVNHSAHLWGALYGVTVTMVIEPRVISAFLSALAHPQFHRAF